MNPLAWLRTFAVGHWILIALIVALIGYHEYAIVVAVDDAKAAKDSEWTGKISAINQKAKDDHDALQAKVDAAASTDNAALAAKLDSLRTSFSQIKARYAPAKPLPADCVLDAQRVQLANQALGQ